MLNVNISFDSRAGVIQFESDSILAPAHFEVLGAISRTELVDEVQFAHLNPVMGYVRTTDGATPYELMNSLNAIGFGMTMDDETKRQYEEEIARELERADELVEY
ncbi:hypothetical protein K7Y63_004148 [Serratia marcescens]